jgi:hypothetical protein
VEHLAFRGSTDELRHLWDVVRAVDHGGNRQALGQYWRVLLEALTLHLEDELPLERAARRDLPGRTIR